MISAFLLAIAGLSAAPAPAPADAFPAYGADTVRSLKGHPPLPAPAKTAKAAAAQTNCHPEPTKGRICRHNIVQAKQERRNAPALAEAAGSKAGETMQ